MEATTTSLTCKNTFVLLRHGESTANAEGIIVSQPENGVLHKYGLTKTGVAQAKAAGRALDLIFWESFPRCQDKYQNSISATQEEMSRKACTSAIEADGGPTNPLPQGSKLVFVSSDFARAKETADLAADAVGHGLPVEIDTRLRERSFGE
eukprot:gene27009-14380_t